MGPCGYKVDSLLRDGVCGVLQPCGHQFCYNGRGRRCGTCLGIHDVVFQLALKGLPQKCPYCRTLSTELQRVLERGVIEQVSLPVVLTPSLKEYLLSKPRHLCGTSQELTADDVAEMAAEKAAAEKAGKKAEAERRRKSEENVRERILGEEAEERAALSRRLVAAGLVGCLYEDGHCHELDAALKAAHGSMIGFTSCWLRDVNQDAGGTLH